MNLLKEIVFQAKKMREMTETLFKVHKLEIWTNLMILLYLYFQH